MRDTDPPLLVLLSIHHDHLALREGQLVWVVGYTVVDGFHSLRPLLLRGRKKAHRREHSVLCCLFSYLVCVLTIWMFFFIIIYYYYWELRPSYTEKMKSVTCTVSNYITRQSSLGRQCTVFWFCSSFLTNPLKGLGEFFLLRIEVLRTKDCKALRGKFVIWG